jgi:spore germination protein YaaH
MTPEEYVSELCDPGDLVGFQFMQVDRDTVLHGWSAEYTERVKQLIEDRQKNGSRFPFPKKPRYV